jgi:uncharacterized BrkB/YihY/UPF0761 family membrane protein
MIVAALAFSGYIAYREKENGSNFWKTWFLSFVATLAIALFIRKIG